MFKKVSIVALGVFAAVLVLNCTKLGSYFSTACKQLRNEAKQSVSIDFEIKRLKDEVNSLDDLEKTQRGVTAEKLQLVKDLNINIQGVRNELGKLKEQMKKASADMDKGAERIVYNGREYPVDTATKILRGDLARARRFEVDIKNKEKLLESRQQTADRAEATLASIRDQRVTLMQKLEQLEADYEQVKLAKTESDVPFDNTQLTSIKQDIEELQRRVSVQQTEVDLAKKYQGAPVVEERQSSEDVNKELKTYLYGDKAENKVTTEKNQK